MPVVLVRVLVVDLRHGDYLFVRIFHRHAQQRRRVVAHYAVHLVVESRVLRGAQTSEAGETRVRNAAVTLMIILLQVYYG